MRAAFWRNALDRLDIYCIWYSKCLAACPYSEYSVIIDFVTLFKTRAFTSSLSMRDSYHLNVQIKFHISYTISKWYFLFRIYHICSTRTFNWFLCTYGEHRIHQSIVAKNKPIKLIISVYQSCICFCFHNMQQTNKLIKWWYENLVDIIFWLKHENYYYCFNRFFFFILFFFKLFYIWFSTCT